MAWPRRMVWLVAERAGEAAGLAAVLRARGVQVLTVLANAEPVWPEAGEAETGPTEAVCWPGVEPAWWPEASQRGIERLELTGFLHSLWCGEVILPLQEPFAIYEGRPLLWHLLRDAGFAPALLWPDEQKGWTVECVESNWCWVIPASWLAAVGGNPEIGRQPLHSLRTVTSIVCSHTVDYYREDLFAGSLPRLPDLTVGQAVQDGVEWALRLGVSWFDIGQTLKSLGVNTGNSEDYLGWNQDDFGWTAGTDREELPAQPVDYLEDRWAG